MTARYLMRTAAMLVLAAAPSAARAQAASPTGAALEEVIVTAQRRTESLQRAAIAVDVVGGEDIIRSNLTSQTQLGELVPALSIQESGGANTTLFLRGVGNFTVNGYSDPAVAFNYDGVYIGRPTSTSGYFYDLERIEVLKGPQGTLYGRNATGGAINVIPVRPKLDEFGGMIVASVGNYDAFNVQGALNVPLGSSTAIRVSGNYSDHSGYLSDGSADEKSRAFRLQLQHEFSPSLTMRVAADYSHSGGRGGGAVHATTATFNGSGYVTTPTGLDLSTGYWDPRSQAIHQTFFASNGRFLPPQENIPHLDNDFYGVNAEIVWNSSAGTFTFLPAYRKSKIDNIYSVSGSNNWIQEEATQKSAELRYQSERFSVFESLVGLYYFDEDIDGNYTFNPQYAGIYSDFNTTTKSYAAFSRLTAHFNDRLRFTGGLRYTHDKKTFDGTSDFVLPLCLTGVCPNAPIIATVDSPDQLGFAVPARGGPPIVSFPLVILRSSSAVKQSTSFNRVTYRLGVEYDIAPNSLLYASFENGYRSGGFSLGAGHETFEPEYIDAYTIGSKNRFLDQRLQVNLEAFLWKYSNQQVSHMGLDVNGQQSFFTENVGESTNKGIEADIEYLATANTLLSAKVQYLDATFDYFIYTAPRLTSTSPAPVSPPYSGCAASVNPANAALYNVDCSGKQSYNSPKWTINFGVQQTIPLGENRLILSADTQYKSSRWVGFGYWPVTHVDANWRSNASATFAAKTWSLTAYVDNIENDRTIITGNIDDFNNIYVMTSAPRTYGVKLAAEF